MGIFAAIIALCLLIFVHELGHFLLAKAGGVYVEKFSIGFGPKLISRKIGETEYLLSAIPLGGYVKMTGEQPGDEITPEMKDRSFSDKPLYIRAAIVFAGPFFNFLFAAVVFMFLYIIGTPAHHPVVGHVEPGSAAETAGLQAMDRIISVEGDDIVSWGDITNYAVDHGGERVSIIVERESEELTLSVVFDTVSGPDMFGELKQYGKLGASPLVEATIGGIRADMPAADAGLKVGDKIVSIDGAHVDAWYDMSSIIKSKPDTELTLGVQRGNNFVTLKVTPKGTVTKDKDGNELKIGLIGVTPASGSLTVSYGVFESVWLGIERTYDVTKLILISIEKLFTRKVSADSIGGPIVIVQMASDSAAVGVGSLFSFMAVISINLAILNLLPVPVLDGGHLFFFLIEAITRRPVSVRIREIANSIGMLLLFTLMFFAFYNDITRMFFK